MDISQDTKVATVQSAVNGSPGLRGPGEDVQMGRIWSIWIPDGTDWPHGGEGHKHKKCRESARKQFQWSRKVVVRARTE